MTALLEVPQLAEEAVGLLTEHRWPVLPSVGFKKSPCVKWKVYQGQLPTVDQVIQWGRH